jgi:predicted nucleic acid-binding protein
VRVFLDTNVLVAAFATRGLCADVFRLVLAEHELLVSATLIEELIGALIKKVRVPEPVVREIVAFLGRLRFIRRGRSEAAASCRSRSR